MSQGEETAEMTGRCLCGAVSFVAPRANLHADVCHCEMCRRWTGGPQFAVGCGSEIRLVGAEHVKTYRSSEWAERAFCGVCGSRLWYKFLPKGRLSLNAGLFDDQSRFTLTEEIFVDEKPGWYELAGDRPRRTGAEVIAAFQQDETG